MHHDKSGESLTKNECDVCGAFWKEPDHAPYQIKLDTIEPCQGQKLYLCLECASAFQELRDCNPVSKLEAISQLLLSLVDLEIEEYKDD